MWQTGMPLLVRIAEVTVNLLTPIQVRSLSKFAQELREWQLGSTNA